MTLFEKRGKSIFAHDVKTIDNNQMLRPMSHDQTINFTIKYKHNVNTSRVLNIERLYFECDDICYGFNMAPVGQRAPCLDSDSFVTEIAIKAGSTAKCIKYPKI